MVRKRRWGYLVWIVAGGVIAIPELIAAAGAGFLPFTTISEMVGHLEHDHPVVELAVVAAIVFFVFSTARVPPEAAPPADDPRPGRTPGGRLTLADHAGDDERAEFDERDAPGIFVVAGLVSLAVIAFGTWATVQWWDDHRHFHPAYVLYGSLALLWIVLPSVVAFVWGADVPFPTLFRTVSNLERWLGRRPWPHNLGPLLGWLVAYTILTGLVILLLHLTLYPYPDITHVLNPHG